MPQASAQPEEATDAAAATGCEIETEVARGTAGLHQLGSPFRLVFRIDLPSGPIDDGAETEIVAAMPG